MRGGAEPVTDHRLHRLRFGGSVPSFLTALPRHPPPIFRGRGQASRATSFVHGVLLIHRICAHWPASLQPGTA
jgi:hypothetical protein